MTTLTTSTTTIPSIRSLRLTLYVISAFQLALGTAFLLSPATTAELFGLPPAPGWTNWLLAMMAARFLGYGWGLLVAARDPQANRAWIDSMILIQAIDWVATIGHLIVGDVTLANVASASFMPLLFVVALLRFRPRAAAADGRS